MTAPAASIPSQRIPLWRDRKVRAVFYQAVFIGAIIGLFFTLYRNTMNNLRERGLTTGFDFLTNESNFTISETLPVPLLEGGTIHFLIAVTGGVFATWLLSKLAVRYERRLWGDMRLASVAIGLLFVVPGLVLYFTGHTIRTMTYEVPGTYGLGLVTGLLNTLKVSFSAVAIGTVVGLFVGIARLSSNWLIRHLAMGYIEVLRNIPLLLQIFFWYFGVLRTLPSVRQSVTFGDWFVLNNRGLYLVDPVPQAAFGPFFISICIAVLIVFYYGRYTKARQDRTGEQLPLFYPSLAVLVLLPTAAWLIAGTPFALEYPELKGFNYRGGMTLTPEFVSLLLALVLYCSAFIAEIVRSGIQAIPKGHSEAGLAIGLNRGKLLRLVILPQARRVMIPPLTANYLSTIKDSSLGVAIGYPEIVAVGTTILDVSGRTLEVIGLIMLFFMITTLLVSALMNWYNARIQIKKR